jgi:hypothetical protein
MEKILRTAEELIMYICIYIYIYIYIVASRAVIG